MNKQKFLDKWMMDKLSDSDMGNFIDDLDSVIEEEVTKFQILNHELEETVKTLQLQNESMRQYYE